MSEQAVAAPTRQAAAPERGAKPGLMLQRKCACGQHTVDGGECAECRKKRLAMQKWPSDRPRPGAVAGRSGAPVQGTAAESAGTDFSHVPARTPSLRIAPRVQRVPDGAQPAAPDAALEAAVEETEATPQSAGPAPPESAPPEAPASGPQSEAAPDTAAPEAGGALLVDDDAADVSGGQLRKAEFLDRLERAVCAQADEALAAAGRSTEGCPYLAQAFGQYRGKSAAQIESGLRRYAPETRNARTAEEYIPIAAARVRQGVERWVRTGEISGVPEGLPIPAGDAMGTSSAAASGAGTLQFKADEGGVRPADDPAAVHDALGEGRPMESGVRSRMERAFGRGFSGVRMHTDATAGRLSREQNARAFAVGGHVTFAAGEYRPGTPAGDALIAHELAHTVQQGSGAVATQAKSASGASYHALEADADRSAAGAVAALWGDAKGALGEMAGRAGPSLRSGLQLQRCKDEPKQTEQKQAPVQNPAPVAAHKITSQTVSNVPADRARTTLGIGEEVDLSTDPAASATWSVTGGGSVTPATGNSTRFTASKTPSTPVVKAVVGTAEATMAFTVIAPTGIQSTIKSNPALGALGPPNNQIGSKTVYNCVVQPTTVSFYKAQFRENIPEDKWTWPDGTQGTNGPKIVPWNVTKDNKTTDTVTSALRPITKIKKGGKFVDFGYTIRVPEDYQNEGGTWVEWLGAEAHHKEFRGVDQKGRSTLIASNTINGDWSGPWQ